MSRRATKSDSAGNTRVKEEKIKEERNKGKQRALVEEEEQEQSRGAEGEEDAADERDDEEETASPRGAKRVRVNRDGASVPSGSQNQEEPLLPKVKTLPRGRDGWVFSFF
jgi:hypothetical protein